MVLRNGEQLLLTVVIPVLVLTVFGSVEVMDLGNRAARVDFLVPGVLALAVMSTAFTGLAIGTGFERQLRRAQAAGRLTAAAGGAAGGQGPVGADDRGAAGGAARHGRAAAGLGPARVVAGRPAAGARRHRRVRSLALLMAGTLRAEATLAAANLVYLLFLVSGGIAVPLDRFPDCGPPVPRRAARRRAVRGPAGRAPRRRPAALVVGRGPRWPGPRSAASWPPAPSAGSSAPYAGCHARPMARLDAAARPPYAGCSWPRWSPTSASWSPAERCGSRHPGWAAPRSRAAPTTAWS